MIANQIRLVGEPSCKCVCKHFLFVCGVVCVRSCISNYTSVRLSVWPFICLSVCPSLRPSVCPSARPFLHLFVRLSVGLSFVFQSTCLCMSVCLFHFLCLSFCVFSYLNYRKLAFYMIFILITTMIKNFNYLLQGTTTPSPRQSSALQHVAQRPPGEDAVWYTTLLLYNLFIGFT